MENNQNFETYLLITSKKFSILVETSQNTEIYKKEFTIENDSTDLLDHLDYFINENIFKIEKILNDFVKKITIILDTDQFFPFEISMKKNNHDNVDDFKSLNHILYEAQSYCKKTFDKKRIIHFLILSYLIDEKRYSFLPKGIKSKNLSVDLKFICLSDDYIKSLEGIFKKYQISLSKILSFKYIKEFSIKNEDVFKAAKKIIKGHNQNEVILVSKTQENKGFFEKFFDFFS